ncbi:MAG: PQQ-binding-like beta-propeller repeat protein, partial [Myxococcales bacterium]|nr:PQQ-binding-like beta-propeller repeat protein [Myxococcales bacterium]
DGVDHGSRLRNVAVDTGLHEVQVRREGFHDRRLRWDARADETREGFVSLVPSEIWSRGYVDFNTAAHAPGDIDGDGRGDILLERGYELIAIDARRDRELWRWSHDMRFASRLELEELDGDGVLDLITIHADGDTYAVEARSSAALDASGLPRSLWRVADESGGLVGKRPAAMIRLDISGDGVRDVITHPFADRRVVAIDALTGQRLWSSEALDPPALDLVLRESDGVELVVAVSARELLAMDARTGVTRWRQAHAAPARSEVYVLENRHDPSGSAIPRDELTWFYQLDDQFVIRRARVRDGEPLWRRAVATRHCTRAGIPSVLLQCRKDATLMLIGNDARARWRYESSARLPALLGWSQPGAAALASHARGAVRLSEDGREQHVFALDGPATAAATLDWDADGDDELVLATSRNTLWAFDERDALVGSTLVTIKPDRLISMGDTDEDGYPELMAMGDTGFALVQGSRARWIRRTQKGIRAAPVVGDYDGDGRRELAVAATLDNNEALHLFDLEGGARLLRSEHLGHDIIRPPARVPGPRGDELIFLDRPDLGVVRFDPARERVLASYPGPRGFGTPTVADLDGDGGDEVIVATWRGPASLWVLDAETLEPRWGVELHYGAWAQPLVARPPARPERPWIVLALLDGTVMVVDPETRETLWTRDFTRQLNESPTVADLDGDGALELLVPRALQHTRELVCLDLATGDEMWSRADAAAVGVRVLVGDLDGDGALEIAAPSQAAGLFMLARDGQVRWTYLPRPRAPQQPRASANPALADLDADGRQELLVAFEHAGLHVLDAATGALLWRLHTEGDETVEAEPVLVDVDEDGQLELVVADTGGALYLLNGTTRRPARGRSPRQ